MICLTGDRTNDHILQSQKSTTELLVLIAHKRYEIN